MSWIAFHRCISNEVVSCKVLEVSDFICTILLTKAGDAKIDNAKFKAQFHTKAKMLTGEQLVELVGHPHGGVCPFAIKEGVKVYLDESLKRFETVFPAAGSANSAIELTIPELEQTSGYESWVDVSKLMEA